MQLRSSAFPDGTTIPRRFTCDGTDLSPPLDWSDAPETTRSFMLLCDDPDAPAGTWHHRAAYDIPADRAALVEGAAQQGKGFKQAINDFQQAGYGGPCPPRGGGIHRYRFRLLALAVDRLPARREPSCQAVEREANKHLLAEAILIGTYQR
jgi:Raf kinase inhibitor-like YbhB/YbcL family protein